MITTMKAMAIRNFNDNNMYKDSASVYRYADVKNGDGSTVQKLKGIPEISAIPCLMNTESIDAAAPSGEANSINMVYTMFISDLISIKAGDYINIRRHGKDYKFIAGEPVKYDFHQEVPLSLKEWT